MFNGVAGMPLSGSLLTRGLRHLPFGSSALPCSTPLCTTNVILYQGQFCIGTEHLTPDSFVCRIQREIFPSVLKCPHRCFCVKFPLDLLPFNTVQRVHSTFKALSTLSQKSAIVAENGETTATVAEFGDCRTFLRQIVALFCNSVDRLLCVASCTV